MLEVKGSLYVVIEEDELSLLSVLPCIMLHRAFLCLLLRGGHKAAAIGATIEATMNVVAECLSLPMQLKARVLDVKGRDDACAVTFVKAVEYVRFEVKPCWHIPALSGGVVNG